MKSQNYLFAFLFTLGLITSCSDDDSNPISDPDPDPEPVSNNITLTIDEYPEDDLLLSVLTTNLTGTITYAIATESVENAFALNGPALFVGERLAFDYETSETVSGIIVASNGTESETINVSINLNNIDDIRAFLADDSRTAYDNADDGEWIIVTETEYNNIANNLADVNRRGSSEFVFNSSGADIIIGGADFTVVVENPPNTDSTHIPRLAAGEYLYAFKYFTGANNPGGANVKLSETSNQEGFAVKGTNLPSHTAGFNYFVLKGNNEPTANVGYLGIYENSTIGFRLIPGSSYFFEPGDSSFISNNGLVNRSYLYQGLTTTIKQWD